MKCLNSNSYKILILLSLLALSIAYVPSSHATALTAKDNMLSFLKNVANIDISKYNITLVSDAAPYNVVNSADQEQVRYILENANCKLDATCLFKDKVQLVWFMMSVVSGAPAFTQKPSTDMLNEAKAVLDRYMNYTGSSSLQAMKDALNTVHSTEDTTVTVGNIKLVIFSDGSYKGFNLVNTYSGADGPSIDIGFNNGILQDFDDRVNSFTVGSTAVNIDQASAINTALNQLKNFSWTISSNFTAMQVSKLRILSNFTQATLSMQVREGSTLYPMWRVEIPVDQVYVGDKTLSSGAYSIAVGIWADTGAINYCQALSYGGAISETPPISQTSPQPQNNSTGWLSLGFAIGIAAITIAIAAVVIQKKRSK